MGPGLKSAGCLSPVSTSLGLATASPHSSAASKTELPIYFLATGSTPSKRPLAACPVSYPEVPPMLLSVDEILFAVANPKKRAMTLVDY